MISRVSRIIRTVAIPAMMICVAGCQDDAGNEELRNDAEALALYQRMVKTLREATSLYYESDYSWAADGGRLVHFEYRCWLKKPNHFRVELAPFASDEVSGVLVGDGDHLWIYWPGGRPRYMWECSGEFAENYESFRVNSYMKQATPLTEHSIGHAIQRLGPDMYYPVLDPSTFHGYADSLQPYVDGARRVGTEVVGGTDCDVIELSIMNQHTSVHLWLSKQDHLPRKLRRVIRGKTNLITNEVWSNLIVDKVLSEDKFAWQAPEDWHEWKMPGLEAGLLKPGTQAPAFELTAVDGETIRLADFRGDYVWLYKWRVG